MSAHRTLEDDQRCDRPAPPQRLCIHALEHTLQELCGRLPA
eukprot:CAMPEP_0198357942 /NCGR_PEP_ID=MMETSP1450-20131203/128831_1 /TAXON_ID=753684 ORGANISM="Madagascaria erythrocladiodes, Strain CCMP3234" /NCGR_SAMPLE_ID=MMETSP1450 /ASSEMBLY_ACC=CAM_ASM_001115 /LENGTH=40 /DNA_ID= /DNA_START= /DNA_END= /DNA_ORIENTATION=